MSFVLSTCLMGPCVCALEAQPLLSSSNISSKKAWPVNNSGGRVVGCFGWWKMIMQMLGPLWPNKPTVRRRRTMRRTITATVTVSLPISSLGYSSSMRSFVDSAPQRLMVVTWLPLLANRYHHLIAVSLYYHHQGSAEVLLLLLLPHLPRV